jgi:hypothetical protein
MFAFMLSHLQYLQLFQLLESTVQFWDTAQANDRYESFWNKLIRGLAFLSQCVFHSIDTFLKI